MLTCVFVLVDWLCVSVALQDNVRPQAWEKVRASSQRSFIGQSLHAIKRVLYERSKENEKLCRIVVNSFSLILRSLIFRHHGREGAGGRRRWTGAGAGLEAAAVGRSATLVNTDTL